MRVHNRNNTTIETSTTNIQLHEQTFCPIPKIIRSLMPKKVIKIGSGGAHNICVTESIHHELPKSIYHSFKKKSFVDVSVIVEEEYQEEFPTKESRKVFQAHKCVLATRSQFLHSLLIKDRKAKEIELKSTNSRAFRTILDFIYLNDFKTIEKISDNNQLLAILKLSQKLEIETLKKKCEAKLNLSIADNYFNSDQKIVKKKSKEINTVSNKDFVKKIKSIGESLKSHLNLDNKKNKILFDSDGNITVIEKHVLDLMMEKSIKLSFSSKIIKQKDRCKKSKIRRRI